jgi:hypothetical protein
MKKPKKGRPVDVFVSLFKALQAISPELEKYGLYIRRAGKVDYEGLGSIGTIKLTVGFLPEKMFETRETDQPDAPSRI